MYVRKFFPMRRGRKVRGYVGGWINERLWGCLIELFVVFTQTEEKTGKKKKKEKEKRTHSVYGRYSDPLGIHTTTHGLSVGSLNSRSRRYIAS